MPMRVPTILAVLALMASLAPRAANARRATFTDSFQIERCTFATRGRNPYFPLVPGHRLELEGREAKKLVHLTITVLDDTLTVDGVQTRVVEERETKDGKLVEVSRNYFAFCGETGSVFYFGEDVDFYEDGVIANHDGSWRAGIAGARAGVVMPGINLVGARYSQEVAPDVALDRAETLSVTEWLSVPAGTFENVLKTKETSALEKGREFKFYAPDVGMIRDADLDLVDVVAP
jgi:hypothetical protein